MTGGNAIAASRLGKEYRIGELAGGYRQLRSRLRRRSHTGDQGASTIWALRDVSFAVAEGEVVGVIGGNGAGKSTLLKIMSRITDPTEGYVDVAGRVGSLLEVGTGFHPDLTGRENVYLNGTILGMKRAEIRARFADIVEFAGVSHFIDTPVKRYSSGMYVRLAFAVAAYLEPEILLIDEVLAVGDAEFQQRCLGRIGEVAREGRTVLFVSHNMQAIRSLCERSLLFERGRLEYDGSADEAVRRYLSAVTADEVGRRVWATAGERPGDEYCRVAEVRVTDAGGHAAGVFQSSQALRVTIEFDVEVEHPALGVGFDLLTADGAHVFRSFHTDGEDSPMRVRQGRNVFSCAIPAALLNTGRYVISLRIAEQLTRWVVHEDAVLQFDVVFNHGTSHYLSSGQVRPGAIVPMLTWTSSSDIAAADVGLQR